MKAIRTIFVLPAALANSSAYRDDPTSVLSVGVLSDFSSIYARYERVRFGHGIIATNPSGGSRQTVRRIV